MIKSFLKSTLPLRLVVFLRKLKFKVFGFENDFRGKQNDEIFDEIYSRGVWGKDKDGVATSGTGSHDLNIITPYIDQVKQILTDKQFSVIVDLGCGDFNVGHNFVKYCNNYIACDVSSVVLEANIRGKQFNIENVEFRKLDLASDKLPEGDIAFVRQVLQHLSNADIHKFVSKIKTSETYKYLLVTEHFPKLQNIKMNLDKPTGASTRVAINSGVELHSSPFNLKAKNISIILEVVEKNDGVDTIIRSTLYEL